MSPGIVLLKAVALSFLRAFIAVLVTATVLPITDMNAMKALAISAVAGGLAAALRTAQALLTQVEPTDQHVN